MNFLPVKNIILKVNFILILKELFGINTFLEKIQKLKKISHEMKNSESSLNPLSSFGDLILNIVRYRFHQFS